MHDINAAEGRSAFPPVVTREEWQRARDALLVKEKSATRALDALAAECRRLPVVVYHLMPEPGDEHVCAGCSAVADSVGPARRPAGAGVTRGTCE